MCACKQVCKVCTNSRIEMVPVDDHYWVAVYTAFIQTNTVEKIHFKCGKLERNNNHQTVIQK